MNNKVIFDVYTDEFGPLNLTNIACYLTKNEHIRCTVNSTKALAPIFSYADKICLKDTLNYISINHNLESQLYLLHNNLPNINNHVYWLTFCNTAKLLKEKKDDYLLTVPSKEMYEKYIRLRPYVVIHARNLITPIETAYNNHLLKDLINILVSNKIKVINTTMHPPNLEYDKNYYIENDCANSYDEQLAIYCNANMVFAIGNSAGITQHILSQSNMCIVLIHTQGNRWVDNPDLGYENKSIYDYRKLISSIVTERISYSQIDKDQIIDLSQNIPPVLHRFFDWNICGYNI